MKHASNVHTEEQSDKPIDIEEAQVDIEEEPKEEEVTHVPIKREVSIKRKLAKSLSLSENRETRVSKKQETKETE